MTPEEQFSVKEVVMEIKEDLKAFRIQYEMNQDKRDFELSKRPTRSEISVFIGSLGVLMTIALRALGVA